MKKIISTCITLMVSAACSISAFAMEVPTNTTIQDLNGVRQYIILEEIAVHVENGLCTLMATDLETWLVAELPAHGDDVSFVFSRTKDVMKACAHFEGELAITFAPKDERDGKIEVLCGQRAAEFPVIAHEDYPECGTIEDGISLRLNAAALFRRVERVRYAAEKGCLDRRPQSACVQFREDRVFSLDGRRMACDTQPDTVFPVPCLLLGDALTHLRAFGENEVAVQIGAHKVCFSDETLKLYVRRYGVDTYDPDAAIPKAYREVITVKTDELLRELTYLKECIGSCTFPYVRFAGQELSMNVPSGRFTTRVSMVGRGDLAIGFNLRYMLDALKQFRKEPTVRIKLSGPYTPIVVEAEGRSDFALVLPVRLRDEMAA